MKLGSIAFYRTLVEFIEESAINDKLDSISLALPLFFLKRGTG